MKIAVTDANIFIDLIKLDLLAHLFSVQLEIHTCEEIIDQLTDAQAAAVRYYEQNGSLAVRFFTAEELERIGSMECPNALEFADRTVVALALELEAEVLTGDGPLTKFCKQKTLIVHGILWLFDRFIEFECIPKNVAAEKMSFLLSYNPRLPRAECLVRVTEWTQSHS